MRALLLACSSPGLLCRQDAVAANDAAVQGKPEQVAATAEETLDKQKERNEMLQRLQGMQMGNGFQTDQGFSTAVAPAAAEGPADNNSPEDDDLC